MSAAAVRGLGGVLVALLLGPAAPAGAQSVEFRGRGDPELQPRVDSILSAPGTLFLVRDTLIVRGDTVRGPVLVAGATLRLEGVVAGDVVAVDADVFLRPSAVVTGDAVNLAGGLYRSQVARIEGEIVDRPLAPYRVTREAGRVWIVGESPAVARLVLPGIFGFEPPTYDRVDGVAVDWGAEYVLGWWGGLSPRLRGRAGYRSERGAFQGGGGLLVGRPDTTATLELGWEEVTVTNDAWIRGDLKNSLAYLFLGKDYRNYHEATRYYAELRRPLARGRWRGEALARLQHETAESLVAHDPWTVLEDDVRFNPAVDEGVIASGALGFEGEWEGEFAVFEGGVLLEAAPAGLGDFGFARFHLFGEWAMQALRDHVLELEWNLMGPLPGSDALPRQRWSFVGGSSTLNTFDIAQFRGDRLLYVETDYTIPLPRTWKLPILGAPDLQLLHRVGMAWTEGEDRDLEQNVGVRLQFFSLYFRLITNPVEPRDDLELDVSLDWPFGGGYPWQK